MQILIVDDDPLAGELVAALLEEQGHDCRLAENGIEALERLAADDGIELVISDLNMPLVSGLDLLAELRESGQTLPFVLLTGDDPADILAQTPGLTAALMKDAALEAVLPVLVAKMAGAARP
ncbi:response regulator [uncultured Thiodictyon sp.]|uniref:response regulator n=1 Tax=uncultured Thiodictyon sp. TaxID=1846217 RepID=UPI0025DD7393|nr:response regulator [uncultured Thiodictyon sp.]